MPIRVDGAEEARTTPDRARRHHDNRGWMVVAGALALILVGVVGVLIGRWAAAPATSSQPPPASGTSEAPRVVEPLPRSGVVAGGGGIGNVYELRTGFPHSTEGAVQAAMNFLITDGGPAYYNQEHYEAIQDYMFASPEARKQIGFDQSTIDAMRKRMGVDDLGRPLTNGRPDPAKRIWDAVYLQYGAYRIVTERPDEVRVMMWYPYVWGVDYKDASSTANLHIEWLYADKTVQWVDGDWRQSGNEDDPGLEVPKPADRAQVVTSFAERADLLGTDQGWTLPANAVEVDTPELQLPGK